MNGMITVAKKSNDIKFLKNACDIGIRDFRFNMDYGSQSYDAIQKVKSLNQSDVILYADFQGVKMRLQLLPNVEEFEVFTHEKLVIYKNKEKFPYITHLELIEKYLKQGQMVSFADGKNEAVITDICDNSFTIEFTKVTYVLRQNVGCSFFGESIPTPHMTKEICLEIEQSKAIKEKMIDWIILSFVESGEEIKLFSENMHKLGIKVMAKIETCNGVDNIPNISPFVDGFMIGRGDLKNTSKSNYDLYYDKALSQLSKFPKLYNGVGTFFLSEYSQTGNLLQEEEEDVKKVKAYGFSFIMLSKEVINSNYPYETMYKLQQICAK